MIPTLIKPQTASGSGEIDFLDGTSDVVFDDTYDHYMFVCTNINPGTNNVHFQFQAQEVGASGWDVPMTTNFFSDYHLESNADAGLGYHADYDQAGTTAAYQTLSREIGSGSDESTAGILHIFQPASTVFVTQFVSRFMAHVHDDAAKGSFMGGYINMTDAVDSIQFKMSSGDFDGVIDMYGIA